MSGSTRRDCHTAPARGRFQASTHMVTFIREECYFSINQTVLRRRPKADTQMSRSPREGTFPRQGCLNALRRSKFQATIQVHTEREEVPTRLSREDRHYPNKEEVLGHVQLRGKFTITPQ